jgi:hypothetical protein
MQEALGKWWGYTTVGTHTQEDKEESSSALSLHREKKKRIQKQNKMVRMNISSKLRNYFPENAVTMVPLPTVP